MANAMPAEIFDCSGRLHLTLDPIDRLCTSGSKLCTPMLARLTPLAARASAISGVNVRGSISTAIAAVLLKAKWRRRNSISAKCSAGPIR